MITKFEPQTYIEQTLEWLMFSISLQVFEILSWLDLFQNLF